MKYIDIHSMPRFRFAHEHSAPVYNKNMDIRESAIEISYLAEGGFIHNRGGEIYEVHSGDIIYNLYDEQFSIHTDCFHRHRTVCADVVWSASAGGGSNLCIPCVLRRDEGAADIQKIIDSIVIHTYKFDGCEGRFAHAFLDILCKTDEAVRKINGDNLNVPSLLADRAKKYIQKNIHSPITQTQVAEYLGISPGYLCSVFKKSEDTTLMKYINYVKLQNIRGLVESKKMKLYEAAAMYGYSDANYVSSLYRKMFGHNITDSAQSSDVSMVDLKS